MNPTSVWVNTKDLVYSLALPRKATRQTLQLCRETGCLRDVLLQGIRLSLEGWGSAFFLLYPFTSRLKASFINQSDIKDRVVCWDTHASFWGTRPRRLWFWLGGTHTQKGCGREITFHLLRHSLNSTRQECEDRASSPEPLLSPRSLQNTTVWWTLIEAAEKWWVLEVAQQSR